jgi:hypothetical protein
MTTPHLAFDPGVLLLAAAVSLLFAGLAAAHVAAYGALLWAGWGRAALFSHRSAQSLAMASMVVALGGYAGATTVVY